jgi:membrane fusion protein
VKLLYDAFPYQRFGIRRGRIRWLSPAASVAVGDTSGFRGLIDLDQAAVRVDGQPRPLLAGMTGRARVVVDRRSLISYAFEPIRQLRESMTGGDQ